MNKKIELKARVFIRFNIEAVTGLHIGGTNANIEIGGVDKAVIRDVITNRPYIPGSSLKGKIRSLTEKYRNKEINYPKRNETFHTCLTASAYEECEVCNTFGVSGEFDYALPTRTVVRDIFMSEGEANRIRETMRTDLLYTEVKTEVSIDRVTSAANPRQMERVPAGARFENGTIIYGIYSVNDGPYDTDVSRIEILIAGLKLLEDDYLGGLGSRGSGQVRFTDINISIRTGDYLAAAQPLKDYPDLQALVDNRSELLELVRNKIAA